MSSYLCLSEVLGKLARHETAVAGLARICAGTDDLSAAGEDRVNVAFDPQALIAGVVDGHVMCRRRNCLLTGRVVDHDVSVGSGRDGSLAREEAKHLRWVGGGHLYPSSQRYLARNDTLEDEIHSILHARQAIRDLGEVAHT